MSIVALVLAAGEQTRWEMDRAPFHKQLMDVAGETIIERIVRQCRERGGEPIVVTHHGRIIESLPAVETFRPGEHRWTVETLLSTYDLWQRRTIVLLGDVIYSRIVMDRIFASQEQELKVFGNEYEIYALSICGTEWYHPVTGQGGIYFVDVTDALNGAVSHAESNASGGGKLRKFYQIYCGLDPDGNEMESEVLDRVCWIQDYTRDIDTRQGYNEMVQKVIKTGLIDDFP